MNETTMLTWIIPVYNGEKYLSQAIESILRQPCGDFSIIVVDDGSKDRSLEIARSYADSRIQVLHKENGGVSSARNMGIDHAKSRYIAFLDADDVVCRDAYNQEINSLLQTEKHDLISFSYFNGDQELKRGNKRTETDEIKGPGSDHLDAFKHCSSFIYHRNLLVGNKPIRFPLGIKVREDVAFQFLVNNRAQNVLGMDKNWFIYRNNTLSVMHNLKRVDYLIKYAIPVWNWCKTQCEDEQIRNHCDARLFAEVSEYIRLSCTAGKSIEEINKALESPYIQETLLNYDNLWSSSKQLFEAFAKLPRKYWLRQRTKGIVIDFGKYIVRFPVMRSLYFRMKYKEDISAIV